MHIRSTILIIIFLVFTFIPTQSHAKVFKIATLSPDGSFWMQKMREGGKEIGRRTNNRIRFKFYPGGVMGDDRAVLRKIRIGQLHGGAFLAGSFANIFPDILAYGLPLKFRSFDEVNYVRERMDPLIIDGLKKGGFVAFGLADGGFAYIMSKKPIRTLDDLRKQKMWIPDNDKISLETLQAFGITPIPLSLADVRTGLQTGLINTVATSPIGAITLQWHTQIKYVTEIPLAYLYGFLAVDSKVFSKASREDQAVIIDVMEQTFKEIDRQNRKDNVEALAALYKQNIHFINPPSEALDEWYANASEVYEKLIKTGSLSRNIVNKLETYLLDYRSQQ